MFKKDKSRLSQEADISVRQLRITSSPVISDDYSGHKTIGPCCDIRHRLAQIKCFATPQLSKLNYPNCVLCVCCVCCVCVVCCLCVVCVLFVLCVFYVFCVCVLSELETQPQPIL